MTIQTFFANGVNPFGTAAATTVDFESLDRRRPIRHTPQTRAGKTRTKIMGVIAKSNGVEMTIADVMEMTGASERYTRTIVAALVKTHAITTDLRMRNGYQKLVINPRGEMTDGVVLVKIPIDVIAKVDALIAAGFTNKRIANALGVSNVTIGSVKNRMYAYAAYTRRSK